jgi:hypothetical protein
VLEPSAKEEIERAKIEHDLMEFSSLPPPRGGRIHQTKAVRLLARIGIALSSRVATVGSGPVVIPVPTDPDIIPWEFFLGRLGAHVMFFEPDPVWHRDLAWLGMASVRGHLQVFPPASADFVDTPLVDDDSLDLVHLPAILTDPRIDFDVRRKIFLTALRKLKFSGHLLISGYNNALQSPAAERYFIEQHLKAGPAESYRFRIIDEGSEPKGKGTHFWICYEVERLSRGQSVGTDLPNKPRPAKRIEQAT